MNARISMCFTRRSLFARYKGPIDVAKKVIKEEGVQSLWKVPNIYIWHRLLTCNLEIYTELRLLPSLSLSLILTLTLTLAPTLSGQWPHYGAPRLEPAVAFRTVRCGCVC